MVSYNYFVIGMSAINSSAPPGAALSSLNWHLRWVQPAPGAVLEYRILFFVDGNHARNQYLFGKLGDHRIDPLVCLCKYTTIEEAETAMAKLTERDMYEFTKDDDEDLIRVAGSDQVPIYGEYRIVAIWSSVSPYETTNTK